MIFNYGFSLVGKSHIANGTCCQDAHKILKMDNGWYIAAVADGVGSAKNSQDGSKIAVETVTAFCKECMPWDYSVIGIKSMMRTAYNYAFKKILDKAEETGEPIESYDTTLSMVIYDGKRIIYGHSGDGAIIGLTTFGDFIEITTPQKGDDGVCVIPLRAGYTNWVIDTYKEDLAAVLLMTDGMLDVLCPYLLRDLQNNSSTIYSPLGSFFADPKGFTEDEGEGECIKKEIENFLICSNDYNFDDFYKRLSDIYKHHIPDYFAEVVDGFKNKNYPIGMMYKQQDDKTMVGLINLEASVEDKEKEFYAEPDWENHKELWDRMMYPHLYEDVDEQNIDNDNCAEDGTVTTDSDACAVISENAEVVEASVEECPTNDDVVTVVELEIVSDTDVSDERIDESVIEKFETKDRSDSLQNNTTPRTPPFPSEGKSTPNHGKGKKKGFFSKLGGSKNK